ncbi:MAG: restriction endonuclease [Chloroflexi bacterium]|nr:restriction endonuclease [Chloroflexota bacterium]
MAKLKRTEFVKWLGPILDSLRSLGGSGTPKEVTEKIVVDQKVSDEILSEKILSGMSRFQNQVYWGRQYLVWEGLLESTKKGVWKLSEKGYSTRLTEDDSYIIFQKWVRIHAERRKLKEHIGAKEVDLPIEEIDIDEITSAKVGYKQVLLSILRHMKPVNFEKFSLLLLRENDFEDLKLTGGSKDEGIDGFGILRINPFVSFRVLFQCKRYAEDNKVVRTQIADFRNAMLGRADKGIFITTGFFTKDAEIEASRDGAPPVELVDGDKLVEMIEKTELGLKPITTYELDHDFFRQYSD